MWSEVTSEQNIQHIIVDMPNDCGNKHFGTERKHPHHWMEIDMHRWSPLRIMPFQDGIHQHECYTLRSKRPICKAPPSHQYSHNTRHQYRSHTTFCQFFNS